MLYIKLKVKLMFEKQGRWHSWAGTQTPEAGCQPYGVEAGAQLHAVEAGGHLEKLETGDQHI